MNNKVTILTEQGDNVEATAPVIISASRSTDIPAFYAKWFFNRLAKGYCAWYNPFNQQKIIVLGTIRSISKRCISLSVSVELLCFGQRTPNQ